MFSVSKFSIYPNKHILLLIVDKNKDILEDSLNAGAQARSVISGVTPDHIPALPLQWKAKNSPHLPNFRTFHLQL